MSAEDFFSRWSRRAAEAKTAAANTQAAPGAETPDVQAANAKASSLPSISSTTPREVTLEDVASLNRESDYSAFIAKGVDEVVKRSAMKKLFADPHFNIMDGLDIYIDDYSVFEPITPATLALMEHAKPLLDPLAQIQNSMMSLLHEADEETEKAASENQDGVENPVMEQSVLEQKTTQAKPEDGVEAALGEKPVPSEPSSSAKPAE